jgi:hypothetical protein
MRRRQLNRLWARLKQLQLMRLTREDLLMKLGAAKQIAPSAWPLVRIAVTKQDPSFTYRLNREKLRRARRREGLSAAHQSDRERSGQAVELVPATGGGGRSV